MIALLVFFWRWWWWSSSSSSLSWLLQPGRPASGYFGTYDQLFCLTTFALYFARFILSQCLLLIWGVATFFYCNNTRPVVVVVVVCPIMPVRRGLVAPRTTLIETIIRKFDTDSEYLKRRGRDNDISTVLERAAAFETTSSFWQE